MKRIKDSIFEWFFCKNFLSTTPKFYFEAKNIMILYIVYFIFKMKNKKIGFSPTKT